MSLACHCNYGYSTSQSNEESRSELSMKTLEDPQNNIAALLERGQRAREKGHFERARRMIRGAMRESLLPNNDKDNLVTVVACLAGTYFDEADYSRAEIWFKYAYYVSVMLHGEHTLQAAGILAKLAELSALQLRYDESQGQFEQAQRIYLLSDSADAHQLQIFLKILIDLSWTLCMSGNALEARDVNVLIDQIKKVLVDATVDR